MSGIGFSYAILSTCIYRRAFRSVPLSLDSSNEASQAIANYKSSVGNAPDDEKPDKRERKQFVKYCLRQSKRHKHRSHSNARFKETICRRVILRQRIMVHSHIDLPWSTGRRIIEKYLQVLINLTEYS